MQGEEDTAKQSTPGKDLASGVFVAVFAVAVMAGSLQLEVPDTRFTAPGLLPFMTGLALLGMSIVLAVRAVRAGALMHAAAKFADVVSVYLGSGEERRAWLLGSLVLGYVVLVAQLSFEMALPVVGYTLSTYEIVSVLVITLILKLFWQATVLRCFLVSLFVVEALALAFRFGFNMIMPEVF
jgi:hypothetical protein